MRKQVFIKTYTSAGVYKGTFYDFVFSQFSENLNGGLSDVAVTIPRRFDQYNSDGALDLGYELQIWVADTEAPNGIQIGSFEINEITPSVSNTETVTIGCSGYIFQLALDLWDDVGKVYQKYESLDPSVMMQDVIDKYNVANSKHKIHYTATSIALTGKSETIEFYAISPLEAIQMAAGLADVNWFWRVDKSNNLYFSAMPTSATHMFIMGKDIQSLKINRSIRDMKTGVLFSNGLSDDDPEYVFDLYSNAAAIASYGRRFQRISDNRYTKSSGSAQEMCSRVVGLYKAPLNTVSLRVLDSNQGNGYDIESINVGDTCRILNINSNDALTSNMLITSKVYNIDYVDLTVVDARKYIDRLIMERRQQADAAAFNQQLPHNYNSVAV